VGKLLRLDHPFMDDPFSSRPSKENWKEKLRIPFHAEGLGCIVDSKFTNILHQVPVLISHPSANCLEGQ